MSVHRSARRGARKGGYHLVADRRATKYGRTRGAHPQGCGPAAVALDRGYSWHPHYETLKHTGEYPIIGVNTFRNPKGDPVAEHIELARSTEAEKQSQLARLADFHQRHAAESPLMLKRLQQAVIDNQNVFEVLMDAVRCCSLGQITDALFEVGGQYRRSM